jgi:hypothetical protein
MRPEKSREIGRLTLREGGGTIVILVEPEHVGIR